MKSRLTRALIFWSCCLQEQVRNPRKQLSQLQQAAGMSPVDPALVLVRQLAACPPNAFDL